MSQPNRKANRKKHCHYQHDEEGLESYPLAPASAPKPDSCASCSSNASVSIVSHPAPTVEHASFNNNLVCKSSKPPLVQPFTESSNAYKICSAKIESNASKNTLLLENESDAPQTSRPKILSDASGSCLVCSMTPSAVKLSISKAVPLSSHQKQDTDSLVQSDTKSSASSSFPSKSVPSSSPQKTNTVKSGVKISNSTNYSPVRSVPYSSSRSGIILSLQWVAKSKASTGNNNIASIPIPNDSPKTKTVLSPVCSAKETITAPFGPSDTESKASEISQCSKIESNSDSIRSSHPTKIVSEISDSSRPHNRTVEAVSGCTQNKPPLDVSTSSSQSVDTVSFVRLDIESNTLESSLPAETVSSTDTPPKPHAVPLPDKSLKLPPSKQWVPKSNTQKISLLSEPKAVVSSTLPITGPCQDLSGETELNDSTNSARTNPEPGDSEIEILKEFVGETQRYDIPKRIRRMLWKNIVPSVLRTSLSPDNYAEYFTTLLYAEDIYCQKWSNFLLRDVTLKLRKRRKSKKNTGDPDVNYPYVEFKINEVRERRPFLLSRDYVHLVPSGQGRDVEAFNGILSYVRNGTTILAEFKEDFHIQHEPSTKYDVSFSFNRVCLKRAYRAVSAAARPLLSRVLFPSPTSSFLAHCDQISPMNRILKYESAPIPYLIQGRRSANMLILIKDTILKIYKSNNESRVLICASKNSTCDALAESVMTKVPRFDLFRANAAFRKIKEVSDDILPACRYDSYEKCFTIPPLEELEKFRIILSTFVNTFGLHKAGLKAGHFSHIFLVDASSAIEPEVIVALTDLVTEDTVIVATGSGSAKDKPQWVRSDIGRNHGLQESLFKRLFESKPYRSGDPLFVTRILEVAKSNPTEKTHPTRTRPDPGFRENQTDSNSTQPEPDIFFWSN